MKETTQPSIRRTGRILTGLATLLAIVSGPLATVESLAAGLRPGTRQDAVKAKGETLLLGVLVHLPNDQERQIYKTIQGTIQQDSKGAWIQLKEKALVQLTPQEALILALRKNLAMRVAIQDSALVSLAVQQADAVFDPVFQVALGDTFNMTYHRGLYGPVYYKHFQPRITQGDPYFDVPFAQESPIDRLGYTYNPDNLDNKTINKAYSASSHLVQPAHSQNLNLSISQQLPWGAQMSLSETTSRKPTYTDTGKDYGVSYDAPWASSMAANILVPLPFTRNFGHYAPQDVAQKQALIAKDRSTYILKSQINTILLQTDQAYWDLVKSVENLVTAIGNRQAVSSLTERTARLLEAGKTTQYGKDQMDAEAARAMVMEESARDAVIQASNALANLVEEDPETARSALFLPVGFDKPMKKRQTIANKESYISALKQRPEITAADLDLDARSLNVNFREQQTRPDVNLSASWSQGQDNSKAGYAALDQSFENLANPDTRSVSGSLAYVYPIGNRNLKAEAVKARESLGDGQLAKQDTENGILKNVGDSLAGIHGARAREDSARRNEQLAGQALQLAQVRREEIGDVPELELTYKQRDLNTARGNRINAMVENKKAESRLLFAMGTLAENLASQTALNEFDQYRIKLLADSSAIPLFAPVPVQESAKAK